MITLELTLLFNNTEDTSEITKVPIRMDGPLVDLDICMYTFGNQDLLTRAFVVNSHLT